MLSRSMNVQQSFQVADHYENIKENTSDAGHACRAVCRCTGARDRRRPSGLAQGATDRYQADIDDHRNRDSGGILRYVDRHGRACGYGAFSYRSEEHTSELQSLMRISYAVFCLKKKKQKKRTNKLTIT